jgi:RND family efflux transporter MFP subunit
MQRSNIFTKKSLIVLLMLLTLGVITQAWYASRSGASSHMEAAPANLEISKLVTAEGRLITYPGAEVTIGADFTGTIQTLAVQEKDWLQKGQLIAEIKADDIRASLAESKAKIAELDADLKLHHSEVARADKLWQSGVGSRQMFDRSQRDLEVAQAKRETVSAEIRRLQAILAKTRVVAPIDGVIITRHTNMGETIESGKPIVTLADLRKTRIEAEVDEFDIGKIKLNDPVEIYAEGYSTIWRGHVEEIPDNVTTRRIKPQDPAKPVDTRVLMVKVALDGETPLKLGQRVEVKINSN